MKAFNSLADIEALERRPLAEVAPHRTPYELIRATAARFPDREAFTFLPDASLDTPPQRVTYRELLAHIHRAANAFRVLGVHEADAVAMLAPNTPQAHAVLWGAQLAGRVCPINFLLQPDHIAALLQASGAKVLVALGPNAELAVWPTALAVQALHATVLVPIDVHEAVPGTPSLQDLMAAQPDTLTFEPDLNPDRVVALFHTGGTTGAPKLAQHTAGNEAHTAWFAHAFYDMDETAVEINGFPLFHVAGAFVYGLALLAIGARQVLPTLSGMRNTGFVKAYWQFCERERVTHLACVPTVLASLLGVPVNANIASVRAAFTGGSPLPAELAQRFEAATGIPVRNILGMTECAGLVSIEPLRGPRTPGSAGLRLPYTEVHAVPWRDGEAKLGERCAAGETGVLVLRGPHMSPGYLDAKRNAGLFESGWIVTGDLGHLDEAGRIHITGRAKDVIIRGSHNIDPGLVEDAFMAHPAVLQCAVVAEPDAYAGEVPVAFVVLRAGAGLDADALLREVAPHVYERPACPKRVVLVELLPLTAIGKVFKPTLRLRAIEIRLSEIAQELAPGRVVRVEASDEGGRQRALITLGGAADEDLSQRLRAALAAIALAVEIRFG
ncbi:AMP-binding protein [Hydrogenophaga sp. PBL-H3]|uniref:AMP-binding protein n=1 Tax=Hydrogenophaga sp. PBL-H3 TaxID=434010 RepID=UPI00131F7121|nr:AMP-binding protein [Hydrogenophaga sp. PBL-H3]QHE76068.1 AMP-binding protein [Hydrogenophaga sp. PBL-H3]QHE80492.1 AMP-binding protein [Hydrogenophaga sp. PBL-H3]